MVGVLDTSLAIEGRIRGNRLGKFFREKRSEGCKQVTMLGGPIQARFPFHRRKGAKFR